MGHRNSLAKTGNEPLHNLRCQRNFWHQHNGLLSLHDDMLNKLHIDFCLATPCDSMKQYGTFPFLLFFFSQKGQCLRLFRRGIKRLGRCVILQLKHIPFFLSALFHQNALLQKGMDRRICHRSFFLQFFHRNAFSRANGGKHTQLTSQTLIFCRFFFCFCEQFYIFCQGNISFFFFIGTARGFLTQTYNLFFL